MQKENTKEEFWNNSYTNGMKYRQFENDQVEFYIKNKYIHGDILDIGCGAGEFSIALAKQGLNVMGVDISDIAIDKAKYNAAQANVKIEFIVGDIDTILIKNNINSNNNIQSINHDAGMYDTVSCKLVYAFINDKVDFLNKVKLLLKKDGTLFISTPVITEENKDKVLKPKICITIDDIKFLKVQFKNVLQINIGSNAYGDEYIIVCN